MTMGFSVWVRACLLLALLKVVAGITAFLVGTTPSTFAGQAPILFALVIAFSIAAGLLILGGRADHRAQCLGTVFILGASTFSDTFLYPLTTYSQESLAAGAEVLTHLHPYTFTPYFLWLFAREFPQTPSFGRQAVTSQ